jgi:hypothetical protein
LHSRQEVGENHKKIKPTPYRSRLSDVFEIGEFTTTTYWLIASSFCASLCGMEGIEKGKIEMYQYAIWSHFFPYEPHKMDPRANH